MNGYKTYIIAGLGFVASLMDAAFRLVETEGLEAFTWQNGLGLLVSVGLAALRHGQKTETHNAAKRAAYTAADLVLQKINTPVEPQLAPRIVREPEGLDDEPAVSDGTSKDTIDKQALYETQRLVHGLLQRLDQVEKGQRVAPNNG